MHTSPTVLAKTMSEAEIQSRSLPMQLLIILYYKIKNLREMLGQLGPWDNRCKLGLSHLQENKEASFFFAPLGMVFCYLVY